MSSLKLHALPGVLTAISAVCVIGFAFMPPTMAAVVSETQAKAAWTPSLQYLKASESTPEPPAARDTFEVSTVPVIQWPVGGDHSYSSDFGRRVSPTAGASSDHKGVDLTPGYGTEVEGIADGTITQAGRSNGLGYSVTVEHVIDGQRITTVYGHMAAGSLRVTMGQVIERGTVIGLVGSTGVSTGAHLHFEVHIDGVPIDPYAWISEHANADDWAGLEGAP